MQHFQKQPPRIARIQPKLQVNQPGDSFEQEADAMADRVMRMTDANQQQAVSNCVTGIIGRSVQRKCAHCEEEEKKLMRKAENGTGGMAVPSSFAASLKATKGGGFSLSSTTKGFMQNAFGTDFSAVKIHRGAKASELSRAIGAKAFTHGNDIYFNEGEYAADTGQGKKLLAHELTHVVQQNSEHHHSPAIQRAIGNRTSCAANTHNSPADPIDILRQANDRAVLMALGASHLLFADSLFMQDASFGSSGILNMYRRRFGDPAEVPSRRGPSRFRNRFNNTLHDTLLLAQASEMQFLSERSRRISEFLNGSIHFICAGTRNLPVGNCASARCGANEDLASCSDRHQREIIICPSFWISRSSIDDKAIGMIHEAMHMLFHFDRDFDRSPYANTSGRRRIEPECYAGLVADIYGIASIDPSCPPLTI